jgi:hypothetical protein
MNGNAFQVCGQGASVDLQACNAQKKKIALKHKTQNTKHETRREHYGM